MHHYLVAYGDRLLMVKQRWEFNVDLLSLGLMPARFEVFEAAGLSSGNGSWRKIESIMGHALFLSEDCSRMLPVNDSQCHGPRENCIYFLNESNFFHVRAAKPYSGVYNITQGILAPLPLEEDVVLAHDGPWTSTWLFPPDT